MPLIVQQMELGQALKACIMATALLTSLTTAHAESRRDADANPTPVSWKGLYVGGAIGIMNITTNQYSLAQLSYGGYDAGSYGNGHFLGGLQGGYDWQSGNIVFGFGADINFVDDGEDSRLKVDEVISTKVKAVSTFTGRLGYLLHPQAFIYVRGGLALSRIQYGSVDERWDLVADAVDKTRTGYTIGGGVEFRLDNGWSVFGEYQHIEFSDAKVTFQYGESSYPSQWTYDYDHTLNITTAGVRYRF